tara:strand:- start:3571 stop:4443 length:873 start_codon:yes stop_codon:yes gene_type:complete
MAFNLNALQQWTEENTDLLSAQILGTEVLSEIAVRTGVSAGTVALNIFSANTADADRACGWNPSGDMTFDQVDVVVGDRQIKQESCPVTLRDYWLAARMAPGEAGNEEVPFEQTISDYFLKGVSKNIEDFIGQAIQSQVTVGNGAGTPVLPGQPLTVANAIDELNNLYDSLDAESQMRDDIKIVMSPAQYRTAVRAFVAADLIHYNFNDGTSDIFLPGTSAKLIKSSGLVGQNYIAAIVGEFVVFATGLMDDMDKFTMFYDAGSDILKTTVFYRRGLGVYNVSGMATNGL